MIKKIDFVFKNISIKYFIAILALAILFLPGLVFGEDPLPISYDIYAQLNWGPNPENDPFAPPQIPPDYNLSGTGPSGDLTASPDAYQDCFGEEVPPEIINMPGQTEEGFWSFSYGRNGNCGSADSFIADASVTVQAHSDITVTYGESESVLVTSGSSKTFEILMEEDPLASIHDFKYLASNKSIFSGLVKPVYAQSNDGFNVVAAQCVNDEDCELPPTCPNNVFTYESKVCNVDTGQCGPDPDPNNSISVDCGQERVASLTPAGQPKFACRNAQIRQNFNIVECRAENYDPVVFEDEINFGDLHHPSVCVPNVNSWEDIDLDPDTGVGGVCTGRNDIPLNNDDWSAECTPIAARTPYNYNYCNFNAINDCPGENCGKCFDGPRYHSDPCGGCDYPGGPDGLRCASTQEVPDPNNPEETISIRSTVQKLKVCSECRLDRDYARCIENANESWEFAIDCGAPQNVVVRYSPSVGFICTITVNYPGQCFYNAGVVGGCRAPTVDIDCGPAGTANPSQPWEWWPPDYGGGSNEGGATNEGAERNLSRCNALEQCVIGGGGAICDANNNGCAGLQTQCNNDNQCVPGGGGGDCNADADCALLPTGCSADARCVPGGLGGACNGDDDCQVIGNQSECNADKQCVPGGGGSNCNIHADCELAPTQCSQNRQCVPGGGGIACTDSEDCLVDSACTLDRQCVPGGDGPICGSSLDCYYATSCSTNNQCVPGGGGAYCGSTAECEAISSDDGSGTACNVYRQCVPGGDGVSCDVANGNADCTKLSCNSSRQCAFGGGGFSCYGDGECGYVQVSCNADKKCVPGGGGALCLDDDECEGLTYGCNESNQCVPGSGGGSCINDTDCEVYNPRVSRCSADRQCSLNGTGALCIRNSDCENIAYGCADNQCVPGGGGGSCSSDANCTDDECTANIAPSTPNLVAVSSDYCSELAIFSWNYSDIDVGCPGDNDHTMKMYRFQVSTNNLFDTDGLITDRVVSRSVAIGEEISETFEVMASYSLSTDACKPYCRYINHGQLYYWRVKVWDKEGLGSEWTESTFTYLWNHPAPIILYSPLSYDLVSRFPAPGDSVYFVDESVCFDNNGQPYACKCHRPDAQEQGNCPEAGSNLSYNCYDGTCYAWEFNDDNADVSTLLSSETVTAFGDVSHIYGEINPLGFMSSLKVCDDLGCCSASLNIPVKSSAAQELPRWKEISPF